jgi:hypothetical protein
VRRKALNVLKIKTGRVAAPWCRGTVPGDRWEVPPTLKISNHYEPNDRHHMNIRKRPMLSPISSPA